jgi:hypothetical protein
LFARKGRLQLGQILIFTGLEYQKFAGKFNEFRKAKADFVFLTRASRFFEKRSKNRLCKAYFLCAEHIFSAQTKKSLRKLYFLCAARIFSAQDIFSVCRAYFPPARFLQIPLNDFSRLS